MNIVHLSYVNVKGYKDPDSWLKRIDFFVRLLEQMAGSVTVRSIHFSRFRSVFIRNGVEYHFIRRSIWGNIIPVSHHRYIRSLQPDVVIVHGFHFPWQVFWLRRQLDDRVLILIQHHSEVPLRHYKRWLQRRIDNGVAGYFFPAFEQAAPWVLDRQIASIRKVVEVMEVPSVFYPLEISEARKKTRVNKGLIYLWVGRLDTNKDPLTLVRAFLRFAGGNPGSFLYMVFQSFDLQPDIEQILNATPLKDRVIMVGKVEHDELLYWFNSADFIVSTSHYEGMGVAVCEAMSCGCIPILTNIPAFRSMTDNGAYGMLYTPGDADGLYNALVQSRTIDIPRIREYVLQQYRAKMSAEAISNKMLSSIQTLKGKF